jgi:hypothetical protein
MAGSPPGTPRLRAVACLGGVSLERAVPTAEIHDYIQEPENVVWVDAQDSGPSELAMLADEFGLDPQALEGASHGQRRPKVDEYKGYSLLVTYVAVPGEDAKTLRTTEVDLFIGRNFVVTLHRGPIPALEQALARWTRGGPRLREGVGFLVYAVMDAIIDSFAPCLAEMDEEIEETESAVFHPIGWGERAEPAPAPANASRCGALRAIFRSRSGAICRSSRTTAASRSVRPSGSGCVGCEREMTAAAMDASLAISSHRLNRR